MATRQVTSRHYQAWVDRAAIATRKFDMPREGWVATTRKALGMSAAALARRLGVSRASVSQAERAELVGGVTLKVLQAYAAAMGCRLVYAIVPAEGDSATLITAQARRKAAALIAEASTHMALEQQSLPPDRQAAEVARIAAGLLHTMPADFWDER